MNYVPSIGIFTYLLAATCAFASGAAYRTDLSVELVGLEGLRIVRNEAFELNYPGTQCVDLWVATSSKKVGLVCRSRNRKFIEDMGISEFSSLPDVARPKKAPTSGLVIATPMAQYNMSLMSGTQGQVATAMVDCDLEAGAIYRATATCHVAVTPTSGEEVLYSNVVMKNHTGRQAGLTLVRIRDIWRHLEKR
jgi:hypothetical protein